MFTGNQWHASPARKMADIAYDTLQRKQPDDRLRRGTQIAVKQKGWSFNPIDVICFTHYHADHISGLPGLLLTIGNSDRKKPLTLVGPKGLGRVVSSLR